MRRKIALILLVFAACAFIALAALPWWLGAALGAVGGRFGLTFGEYRRIGYTRFVLTDVEVRRPGVQVKASQVESGTPLVWLARRPGEVTIGRWSVTVTPADAPKEADQLKGWQPLRSRIEQIVTVLELWLPSATTGAGEVAWPGGTVGLDAANWKTGDGVRLQITALTWREQTADLMITRGKRAGPVIVEARATKSPWAAKLESEGARLSGNGSWAGQPLSVQARFSETGWLPVEAKVQASDWNLAAERAGLGEFYEMITGRADITWQNGHFSLDVEAAGKPQAGSEAPPLQVKLHGAGGLDQLNIERLDVELPGVTGHLSEPVIIGRDGRLQSEASRFDLTVDLAKQPWFEGRGSVTGVVKVIPRSDGVPWVTATLSTADAAIAGRVATSAEVEADLDWPRVRVKTAAVKLKDGDELELGGDWDFRTRTLVQGRVKGRVSRETVAPWLTTRAGFETLEVEVAAAGVWPQVVHEGRARALGLQLMPLQPLGLDVDWKGTGRTLDAVELNAVAGGTRVRASGAVAEGSARVDQLVLTQAGAERLNLMAPVRVQWAPSLSVGEFRLKGPEGEISAQLTWGEAGEMKLAVKNFDSAWLRELWRLPGPDWSVASLAVEGEWNRGPLVFTAEGAGVVQLKDGRRAELALSAAGNEEGVRLETLSASMEQRLVARATGKLPLTIYPGQPRLLRIDETSELSVEASTEPNAFFWEQLGSVAGLVIDDPVLRIKLGGTAREPLGEATVRIARMVPDGKGRLRSLPDIVDVDVRVTADRSGVKLETFTLKAAGQLVHASGRLPVKQWTALLKDPFTLLKAEGEARIEIPDAQVAALARYAPAYLAPTGTLQVDVELKHGGQLQGIVRLKDAASRPLGPLGTLQSIGAEIVLDGRTVELKEVRAVTGGQPVTLSGKVNLPEGKEPRFDLVLRGEKLPFVRQAGLLMRGDVDLRIVTGEDEITRITGATRFRNSFFLMDVRALLPSGGARNAPGRRPPYFAVEVPPFNEWQLDVSVEGDRFLRLRTPVFNGLASTHVRLHGTLGDPRATGEAVINEGKVLLPFATFVVRQGWVRLTETNPFEPQISLIGTGRRYGYDLRMEIRGTADKPQLTFSSTPALESEQVLLMVMAGETPQNEVSYTGRERAARLGAYLGQSLLKQLGGDPEATERLSVSTGERVSRQGRETYDIEYALNPRWAVVGEYDEFDEYNLGLKWRVLSEKKTEEEKNAPK